MQLAEGAARWASTLREHGVRPDDRVIVLAGSGLDWLEVILGVMKIGAVTVPCTPTMSTAALEVRVSSTEAALIVAEHSCRSTIEQMSFSPEVHYLDEGSSPTRVGRVGRLADARHVFARPSLHSLDPRHSRHLQRRGAHAWFRVRDASRCGALARRRSRRRGLVHGADRLAARRLERARRALVARCRGRAPSR